MRNSRYQYSAGNHVGDHEPDSRFDFPKGQCIYFEDWQLVARDLAEDYHNEHDGWEASWPIALHIYADNECVWSGMVEREMEACFYVE
jgi:hypothetical protein